VRVYRLQAAEYEHVIPVVLHPRPGEEPPQRQRRAAEALPALYQPALGPDPGDVLLPADGCQRLRVAYAAPANVQHALGGFQIKNGVFAASRKILPEHGCSSLSERIANADAGFAGGISAGAGPFVLPGVRVLRRHHFPAEAQLRLEVAEALAQAQAPGIIQVGACDKIVAQVVPVELAVQLYPAGI